MIRNSKINSQNTPASVFYFALFAILAMACYQLVLCFVNTHVFPVSNALLGGIEGAVLLAVMWKISPELTLGKICVGFGLAFYFMILWAIRGEIDLFGPRNLLIIFSFYLLGRNLKNAQEANRIVWVLSALVVIFALLEYFFTDAYLRVFDILNYYISRGEASTASTQFMTQNLFANGIRFDGRNLLPFLGDHRVSSIFLEPISMGNYATIVAMWFLSLDWSDWRKNGGHAVVAIFCVIACDSRFACISLLLLCLVRFIPLLQWRGTILIALFASIGFLMLFSYFNLGNPHDDNLPGRLARSGATILNMEFISIFGLSAPRGLMDMGMSYSIEHFGIFLIIALWMYLSFLKTEGERERRFRAMLAFYLLSVLMISGSCYSAKTASLLWLLLGVLSKRTPSCADEDSAKENP